MRLRRNWQGEKALPTLTGVLPAEPKEIFGRVEEIFGRKAPLHLELGMGKGDFILAMAARYPEINFIGVERNMTIQYIAAKKNAAAPLPNLRFLPLDAQGLDLYFRPGEVQRIYLNFSDPWPKSRHARRRLTHVDMLRIYQKAVSYTHLPGYLILAGLSVLFGLVIAVSGRRGIRRGAWALGIYLVVSFLVLGILPGAYQQFIVDPNEISREQPYISRSIDYTKLAYNLDEVETVEYPVGQLSIEELKANQDIIDNIRILDQNATHTTYSQQQELRRYYEFADVDVDRYVVDGKYTQVMVAAREMNPAEIPEQSKNFNNLMFQYTHGFGVAMSPANKVTSTGLPDYLVKDIPPVSKGITITQPRIYYGELTYDPVIVKTELAELDYTDGDNNKDYFYEEESGIPMKGLNRLLLAFRDMEYRYLFSGNINGDSLYLETRNVMRCV